MMHDSSTIQHNLVDSIALFIYSEAFFQMWSQMISEMANVYICLSMLGKRGGVLRFDNVI